MMRRSDAVGFDILKDENRGLSVVQMIVRFLEVRQSVPAST